MQITISKMTNEDLNCISKSLLTDFDDFWNESTFKSELENSNSYYIVAKDNSEIIGFAGIWFGFEEAHITNIVTKKDKRNLGIGTKLLENLISICKQKNNIYVLTLEVNINNVNAISLYEKFEFKIVGQRKKYYNNTYDALIMTKKL